jgi:outer membrane protein TolC
MASADAGADRGRLKLSLSLKATPAPAAKISRPVLANNPLCPSSAVSSTRQGTPPAPATLQQAFERARLGNPEVARALAQVRKAQADVNTAGSAYSPQLRFNATSGTNGGSGGSSKLSSAANAQLTKLLHDFGKTDNLIEEARKREAAKSEEHRDTLNRITLEIVENWLNAARQAEIARLHQQASEALEDAVRILRLRAEAGLAGSGDVGLAQARLAQTQAAGMAACAQKKQLLSRLSLLSAGPVDDGIFGVPATFLQSRPTSAWDPSNLPGVRQAEAEHQAATFLVQSIKAARWPSVYVQAGRGKNGQSDSSTNINLTLSMDVLEAGTQSRIESATADVQAARLRIQSVRESAEDTFRRINTELQDIDTRRPIVQSQAQSTAATRRIFMDQFLAGRRPALDLLNTHQEVLAADVALAGLGFDHMVLVARLHALHDQLAEALTAPGPTSSSIAAPPVSTRSDLPITTSAKTGTTSNRTP